MKHILFIILIFWSAFTFAQQTVGSEYTIRGRVISKEDNYALPGVNVIVKGTTTGTVTDSEGNFQIRTSTPNPTLIFSFVGFITQEVKVRNQDFIQVTLVDDVKALEEVVVAGYGESKKSYLTGAVTEKIDGDNTKKDSKNIKTWKRSGLPENSIKLSVGENDDLPLQGVQIAVQIDGFRVRVLIDCYFYNGKGDWLEGTFKLRLPNGASPYFFAFGETVYLDEGGKGGKSIPFINYEKGEKFSLQPDSIKRKRNGNWNNTREARVTPKEKAAYAYKETVTARIDPALMEWAGADVFNCRVNPLRGNRLHRIVVGYDVNLTSTEDAHVYNLVIPKYKAPILLDFDIAQIPETVIQPQVATFTHKGRTQFQMRNPAVEEIKIAYPHAQGIVLKSPENESEKYFATSFKANLPTVANQEKIENAIFLLDVSLSSNPDKFNIWLQTMSAILANNQDEIKNFAVMCFNVNQFWWQEKWTENTKSNLNRVKNFVNNLVLIGATDLGNALKQGSNPHWNQSSKAPKYLFLLSDGDATWGESNIYQFSKSLNVNDKLFAFSTGMSGTDLRNLDHLSRSSNGAVFSIANEDEITKASRAFRFQPWHIEEITLAGASDFLIGGRPQYLYPDQKIILSGRGNINDNAKLKIKLSQKNNTEELNVDLSKQIFSSLTKRVYGQIAVNQIEEFGYLTEKEAIRYATHFEVAGQTCSFVMLESEREYQRFGINREDNLAFIETMPVSVILKNLFAQYTENLSSAKANFMQWVNKLSTIKDGMRFSTSASLDSLLQSLPEQSFETQINPFKSTIRSKHLISEELKEGLNKESLDYDFIIEQANMLKTSQGTDDALLILSNFAEKNAGDGVLMRDIAFSAMEWKQYDKAYQILQRILLTRPYEPPTYQAIAQALWQSGKIDLAMLYYEIAYQTQWDARFQGFNLIVGLDYLKLLQKIENKKLTCSNLSYAQRRLQELRLDFAKKNIIAGNADIVVVITWNTDNTDVDLHIKEPSGETCFYGHKNTNSGGFLSNDATGGFGPEMYYLANAPEGKYRIKINYYGDYNNQTTIAKSKVYISVYRNFGLDNEEITQKVITLKSTARRMSGNTDDDEVELDEVMTFKVAK